MEQLAQLKDIHLPEPISHYPIAIGWWILATLCLVFITWSLLKYRHYRRLTRGKKQALAQMKNHALSNSDTIAILKWASLQYFPREQSARLYGEQFQQFLRQTLPENYQNKFDQLSQQHFSHVYKTQAGETVTPDFQQAAILWLNHALPPKPAAKSTLTNNNKELSHD